MGTLGLNPDWEVPKIWGPVAPPYKGGKRGSEGAQGFTQVGVYLTLSLGQALK